MLSLIGGKQIG